jgi:hypothetical protein
LGSILREENARRDEEVPGAGEEDTAQVARGRLSDALASGGCALEGPVDG